MKYKFFCDRDINKKKQTFFKAIRHICDDPANDGAAIVDIQ